MSLPSIAAAGVSAAAVATVSATIATAVAVSAVTTRIAISATIAVSFGFIVVCPHHYRCRCFRCRCLPLLLPMLSAVAAVATVFVSMQSQPLLLPPPLLPLFPWTSPLPPKQYFEHHPGERSHALLLPLTIAIVADVGPAAAAAATTTAISSTIAAPFWLTVVSFSPFAMAALWWQRSGDGGKDGVQDLSPG